MKKMISVVLSVLLFAAWGGPAYSTGSETADVFGWDEENILRTVNLNAQVDVNANAYVLMDVNTGTLLAAKNEDVRLYPASVTKIMTLLLVCEALEQGRLALDETLTCSDTAAAKGGSQIWLEPGEQMTVRELIKASAVYSANDACTLLGEAVAGSEAAFVDMMNKRARELGMSNTHFDNCTGLDDDTDTHLTTAYDVAVMSRALIRIDFIRSYTTIWMDSLRDGQTQLVNTNKLIRYYPGATGLKTGTTNKAGCCVSATAERDGMGLIAVVMGAANSNDRFNGARALLDYGFANYEIYTPEVDLSAVPEMSVAHGERSTVGLVADRPGEMLVDRGVAATVTQKASFVSAADAPVAAGQRFGEVRFYAGDALIAEYPLYAAEDVPALSFLTAFLRIFRSLSAAGREDE